MDFHTKPDKAMKEDMTSVSATHASLALALSLAIESGEKWKILPLNGPGHTGL